MRLVGFQSSEARSLNSPPRLRSAFLFCQSEQRINFQLVFSGEFPLISVSHKKETPSLMRLVCAQTFQ